MINLNWYAWQNTIRSMADSVSKKLVFEEDIDQPRTDFTTVYVQKPKAEWTEHQFKRWAGEVCHEIGHIRGGMEKYLDLREEHKIAANTLPGIILNIVEDYDNEKNELGLFKGRDSLIEYCRRSINEEGVHKVGKHKEDKRNLLEGINSYFQRIRDWQPSVPPVAEDLIDALSEDGKKYLDKMEELDLKEELDSYQADPEQSWDITKRIIVHLGLDLDKELEHMQQEYEKAQGSGNTSSKGENSRSNNKGKEEGESESSLIEIAYKDLLQLPGTTSQGHGLKINYEGKDLENKSYTPSLLGEMIVKDWAKSTDLPNIQQEFQETSAELVAAKFRRLLQIATRKKIEYNKNKGKLSTKSLYKVTAPVEASDQWNKIFKTRASKFTLDTAVTVLVDSSGSMGGPKWEHASYGLIILRRMLKTLAVPHELLAFTEGDVNGTQHVINHIIKGFKDNVSEDKIKTILGNIRYEMGCNNDLDSVLFAYNRLQAQKEKRKLLIVLSDGQPASVRANGYEMPGKFKEVLDELYKRKDIEIYSIGIMSDAVKWFYKKYRVIESVEQLEEALLSIVSSNIIHEAN